MISLRLNYLIKSKYNRRSLLIQEVNDGICPNEMTNAIVVVRKHERKKLRKSYREFRD